MSPLQITARTGRVNVDASGEELPLDFTSELREVCLPCGPVSLSYEKRGLKGRRRRRRRDRDEEKKRMLIKTSYVDISQGEGETEGG